MSIAVADNFQYKGSKPLDARIKYNTVADMKAVSESDLYDGCLAYVTATKKNYQYDSSNTTDPTTGKWRELQTGGGGGEGGHIIEDNGTEMTQRDTLNFVDFDLEDDTQNEKTVVQAHELTPSEFNEIFSTLPTMLDKSVVSNEANNLSLSEKVIGTWIDGKPLYQKVVNTGALPSVATTKTVPHGINNIETVVSVEGIAKNTNGTHTPLVWTSTSAFSDAISTNCDSTNVNINVGKDRSAWTSSYVTIKYTKTTDTAVANGEKIVGQWIDGKPIYEAVVSQNICQTSGVEVATTTNFSASAIVGLKSITTLKDNTMFEGAVVTATTSGVSRTRANISDDKIYLYHICTIPAWFPTNNTIDSIVSVVRYTKS